MAGWRELRKTHLGRIHKNFEIPAAYLASETSVPIRVNVRLHKRHSITENTLAQWGNAASLLDEKDRIIFDASEKASVLPRCYVIFSADEAYITGPGYPVRWGYIAVEVTEVPAKELQALISKLDLSDKVYEGILT